MTVFANECESFRLECYTVAALGQRYAVFVLQVTSFDSIFLLEDTAIR